jgi:chromosomal replication initiator protein
VSIEVSPAELWTDALRRIEGQLNKPTMESFLKVMRPVGLQGDTFVFAVPNRFAKDWVEQRLLGVIRGALRAALGRAIEVRVTVAEAPAPPPAVRAQTAPPPPPRAPEGPATASLTLRRWPWPRRPRGRTIPCSFTAA